MKKSLMIALLATAAAAQAQVTPRAEPAAPAAVAPPSAAKKALLDRLVALQQPGLDSMARGLAEQPLRQMLGAAQQALPRVPEDKREAAIQKIEGLAKQYSDDVGPIAKDKAGKLGQTTLAPQLNERFTEDELRQLLVALESPAYKKYQAALPELGNAFTQQLVTEMRPSIEPKLKTLEQNVAQVLGLPLNGEAPKAKSPAAAASKPKK
jgi:hypothetical protein